MPVSLCEIEISYSNNKKGTHQKNKIRTLDQQLPYQGLKLEVMCIAFCNYLFQQVTLQDYWKRYQTKASTYSQYKIWLMSFYFYRLWHSGVASEIRQVCGLAWCAGCDPSTIGEFWIALGVIEFGSLFVMVYVLLQLFTVF